MGSRGVASDGKNLFVTTGNTFNTGGNWSGGEAVIRFQHRLVFSGSPSDYWVPENWQDLDAIDWDLGGCGPFAGGCPWRDAFPLGGRVGQDEKAYLLNRDNLAGLKRPHWTQLRLRQQHYSGGSYLSN